MIFKHFSSFAAALAVVVFATANQAFAAQDDEAVLAAYDAYRAGDAMKFARMAKKLESHSLAPWIEYWRLAMRLEDAQPRDVQEYLDQHGATYAGELMRLDWAKVLGKRRAWGEFERVAAAIPRPDLEVKCYALGARLAHGDESAGAEVWPIWLTPEDLPDGCDRLTDALAQRGFFSITDIWQRVRVLFDNGQITAAKGTLGYLPKREGPDERLLAEAARTPKRVLERLPKNVEHRATREVVVLAALRHARNDPQYVAQALEGRLGDWLPERETKYLWGRVALEGARQHHDLALRWFARAGDSRMDDTQLAWKTRAALRRGLWGTVRSTIDRMPADMRGEPAWTYWYGRALAAQNEEAGARAYYLRIAGQTDFYGLLANEELGYVATLPESAHTPGESEVAAAGREPGLARALELIRLGIRTEGVREWLFTIRSFDDMRLLAASELARRAEVYDRAIQAADRTLRVHNFALRYPVPYQDVFREYARTQQLDEAWVFGLVRQESRFVSDARSSAGAAGLMQVMPRTARYVAQHIGLRNYKHKQVAELQTNVNLGTGYLKMVLNDLGHPVLASAAYNAGPNRARRWRDARPLEGAIYAETIPFGETRDYVKKVMANTVFYAALLEKRIRPLKEMLGAVPARKAGEPVEEDDDTE